MVEYPTSMSLSLKVILLVSCRKALLALVSTTRHSTLAPKAMLIKASMTILRSFTVNSNWSNKFLNWELLYKVVMAVAGEASLYSLSSPEFA